MNLTKVTSARAGLDRARLGRQGSGRQGSGRQGPWPVGARVGLLALLMAAWPACSESPEDGGDGQDQGSTDSSSSGGNNSLNLDGSGSTGSGSPGSGSTGSSDTDSGSTDSGTDSAASGAASGMGGDGSVSFEECVGNSAEPEANPAIIQILLDTSLSMQWSASGSNLTKLEDTRAALQAVLDTLPPTSAIGLSNYPNVVYEEGGTCYDGNDGVLLDLLGPSDSEHRVQLADALDATVPNGGTPTHMAYLHALELVQAANLPGQRYVLIITDGTPTYGLACSGTGMSPVPTPALVLEAAKAYEDENIRTFVVGSPGSEDALEPLSQMASNGGTARDGCSDTGPVYCHFDMTESENFQEDLREALVAIVGQALSCEYEVPDPPNGQQVDPDLVNVLFTDGNGDRHELGKNGDGEGCSEGWYYSDDGRQVVLCDDTCDLVRSDVGARLDVVFGCETVTVVK